MSLLSDKPDGEQRSCPGLVAELDVAVYKEMIGDSYNISKQ